MSSVGIESLSALRAAMAESKIDALVVTDNDYFSSEEPPAAFARRSYMSGFNGSNGTAVITADKAMMETDSRYFVQCKKQLYPGWERIDNAIEWITNNVSSSGLVVLDKWCTSKGFFDSLTSSFKGNVELTENNLVDTVWKSRPALPNTLAYVLENTGESVQSKISRVCKSMLDQKASLSVAYCDQVAWLLNLRGGDYDHSPLFIGYAVIEALTDQKPNVTLFCNLPALLGTSSECMVDAGTPDCKLGQYLHANGVSYKNLSSFADSWGLTANATKYVSNPENKVWLCPNTNLGIFASIDDASRVLKKSLIIDEFKTLKNEVELQAMKDGHCTDGLALSRFLHWLDVVYSQSADNIPVLDECDIAEKNLFFRMDTCKNQFIARSKKLIAENSVTGDSRYKAVSNPHDPKTESDFVSESFPCLSQVAANAAMPHYSPQKGHAAIVRSANMFLCDSGAQYSRGCTTDVTRTVWLGCDSTGMLRPSNSSLLPSPKMISGFTRVLMGFLDCCDAVFPVGSSGTQLDVLARGPLHAAGLDFGHGTGHGVASFGLVHEPPMQIRPTMGKDGERRWWDFPVKKGTVTSVEPGLYIEGEFGIRIENLVVTVAAQRDPEIDVMCAGDPSLVKELLTFRHLTLAPICMSLIDTQLMSDSQINSLNKYHVEVRECLLNIVEEGIPDEQERETFVKWLMKATRPLESPRHASLSTPPSTIYI